MFDVFFLNREVACTAGRFSGSPHAGAGYKIKSLRGQVANDVSISEVLHEWRDHLHSLAQALERVQLAEHGARCVEPREQLEHVRDVL